MELLLILVFALLLAATFTRGFGFPLRVLLMLGAVLALVWLVSLVARGG